jgi:hypothetical protein
VRDIQDVAEKCGQTLGASCTVHHRERRRIGISTTEEDFFVPFRKKKNIEHEIYSCSIQEEIHRLLCLFCYAQEYTKHCVYERHRTLRSFIL